MSENPSSKSSKVQTDNADIRANNVAGGALVIGNNKTQTSGDLVKVTGTAGQSALNVTEGNATVAGETTLQGGLNLTLQTVEAPATPAAAATASRILTSAGLVLLNAATNADDRAYLPSPTSVSDGKFYIIQTDGTGCELSAEGDGSTVTTINGTAVTDTGGAYAKELALAANSTFIAVKTGANAWTVTPGAAAPDA